jgi:two-component sensor histidine kinase
MIHELLYTGDSLNQINIAHYIKNLVGKTKEFYKGSRNDPSFSFDIEPLRFSTRTATIIGIILSELLTNTFKYAVVENGLAISISLRYNNDEYVMTYSDSGKGLSESVKSIDDLKQGTGLTLIKEFVASIGGSISLDTSKGATFRICFTGS